MNTKRTYSIGLRIGFAVAMLAAVGCTTHPRLWSFGPYPLTHCSNQCCHGDPTCFGFFHTCWNGWPQECNRQACCPQQHSTAIQQPTVIHREPEATQPMLPSATLTPPAESELQPIPQNP